MIDENGHMMNFAILVLAAPLLIAQSQPPAPVPMKPSQEKKSAPVQPQVGSQNSAHYGSENSTATWFVAILTAVIAGAACVQVHVYHRQAKIMEAALGETAKAAEAARVGATAARDHVNTSKAAMDAAVASAAESAKVATDALNYMRQQSAAQERFADATERLVEATEPLAKAVSHIDTHPC